MNETVGEGLPEPAVQECAGNEAEAHIEGNVRVSGQSRHRQHKIGSQVPENQAAGGAAELGKGKRSGTKPGHRVSLRVNRKAAECSEKRQTAFAIPVFGAVLPGILHGSQARFYRQTPGRILSMESFAEDLASAA